MATETQTPIRVLVVDDNDTFRAAMKDLLEPYGFVVTALANPVKALELFNRNKDSFDVVVLDYYMPVMDGGLAHDWIRKLNPQAKIILCSGADELRLRQLQAQYGVANYIRKPFRTQDLVNLIYKVLGRTPPPAPAA